MSAMRTVGCNYCGEDIEDASEAETVTLGDTDIVLYFHRDCLIAFLDEADL